MSNNSGCAVVEGYGWIQGLPGHFLKMSNSQIRSTTTFGYYLFIETLRATYNFLIVFLSNDACICAERNISHLKFAIVI